VSKHDYAHSLSFHLSCLGARISAHRLIRYPFADTSIVPFDAYGRSLLRHRWNVLDLFAAQMLRRELTASTASEPGTSLELVGE
jgi:hypothetical protein